MELPDSIEACAIVGVADASARISADEGGGTYDGAAERLGRAHLPSITVLITTGDMLLLSPPPFFLSMLWRGTPAACRSRLV